MMEDLFNADLDLDFDVDPSGLDFLPDDFEFEFSEEDLNNLDESDIPDLAALIRLEEEHEQAEAAAAVAAVVAAEEAEQALKDAESDVIEQFTYDLELEANNFFTDEHQFNDNFASTSFKDNSFKDSLLKECAVLSDLFGLNGGSSSSSSSTAHSDCSSGKQDDNDLILSDNEAQMSPQSVESHDSGIDSSGCTPVASPAPSVVSSKDLYDAQMYLSDGNSMDGSSDDYAADAALNFAGINSYYAFDQDNNLVRQPLNSLTREEMRSLSAAFADVGVPFSPEVLGITPMPTIVTSRNRRKRAKGVSLLAKPPTSFKHVKREPQSPVKVKSPANQSSRISMHLHQDHDYCSEIRVLN
jgi:hypothetical protein